MKLQTATIEVLKLRRQLRNAEREFMALPRKSSFSGWAKSDEIDALERKIDKAANLIVIHRR